jgi:hypothetical protein
VYRVEGIGNGRVPMLSLKNSRLLNYDSSRLLNNANIFLC